MKTTELKIIFEMKFYWMGLTVNWTLQKTNNPPKKKTKSIYLQTGQQKLSKLKHKKIKD